MVWCSAWLRRHEIFACSSWKPSSSHRQRVHHAFLSPGPRRRFLPRPAASGTDFQLSPGELGLLHCSAQCSVPGWHQNSCSSMESASAARSKMRVVGCWRWCHCKATLVCIFQSVCYCSLMLTRSWQKSQSYFCSRSVDTKMSLQRCLNKKRFILWKCFILRKCTSRVPCVSCLTASTQLVRTFKVQGHAIAKHQPWSLVLIIWGCDHHHNALMSSPCLERKKMKFPKSVSHHQHQACTHSSRSAERQIVKSFR